MRVFGLLLVVALVALSTIESTSCQSTTVYYSSIVNPVAAGDIPEAYLIPNVPYHRQLTDFTCGDASLEMVLNYYGPDVSQFSIVDAARTTSDEVQFTSSFRGQICFSSDSTFICSRAH